jgi:sugar lactone lactonase YvrE
MNQRAFARSLFAGLVPALGLVLCGRPATPAEGTPEPGTLVVVVGTGVPGYSGDGGPATKAQLREATGLAVDAAGNLYIADWGNDRVRRVGPDETITTIVGPGSSGSSGDNGPAREANLQRPTYLAFDAAGNLFIGEDYKGCVRKVSPDGIITTVAGGGHPVGGNGDGGPATNASIGWPHGLALDREGNLFVAESEWERVRKVSLDGTITTVAGTGKADFSGDGGPAAKAKLSTPNGLATDMAGNLYIADMDNNRVRRVGTDGIITTVAGIGAAGFSGDGGSAREAQLNQPFAVAVDSAGNLFISEWRGGRVRKVSPDGIITTVAGGGTASPTAEGAPATTVALKALTGIAVDAAGNLYISDSSLFGSGRRDWVLKVSGVAAPGLIGSQPFPQPQP